MTCHASLLSRGARLRWLPRHSILHNLFNAQNLRITSWETTLNHGLLRAQRLRVMIPSSYCEARHRCCDKLALYATLTCYQHFTYAPEMGGQRYCHYVRYGFLTSQLRWQARLMSYNIIPGGRALQDRHVTTQLTFVNANASPL